MSYKPLKLVVKPNGKGRSACHYDTVPHAGCIDGARCDCECRACLVEFANTATPRTAQRIKVILTLLANPATYETFPSAAATRRSVELVQRFYSPSTRQNDIAIGLLTIVPQVRALRMRGVR